MLATPDHPVSLHAPPPAGTLRTCGVGLVLLACLCEAAAQEAPAWTAYQDRVLLASPSDESAAQWSYEVIAVRSRVLAPTAPRVNLDGRTANDLAGVTYRVWMSSGRAAVGVGIGTLGYLWPSADGHGDGPRTLIGAVPNLSLGVRYRMSNEHSVFADASGARGLGADAGDAYYTAKVGVEWKPAKAKFGFEQGALGVRFDSGYKLALKARSGGAGLYLRGQF
jgi:hypothetical protein